jgi:flagellar protein FliO/FliZ
MESWFSGERRRPFMQMLQQIFGVDGAKYVAWLVTALGILLLALFVWWLIRKALGDRINMSDRADRRGRPPRLGVTETFSIGPQGRRLVMVRRDNVEHLIMIGGPNDVVIETNVLRGERPTVGRSETRQSEADPVLLPDPTPVLRAPVAEPKYEPRPEPKPEPRIERAPAAVAPPPAPVRPVEVAPPAPVRPVEAAPPPPPAPPPPVPPAPTPPAPPRRLAPAPVPEPPPAPPRMTLAERIKAGAFHSAPAPNAPPAPVPEAANVEPPKVEQPKVEAMKPDLAKSEPPKAALPPVPTAAEMKAKLEEAVQAKLQAVTPVKTPPPAEVPPPPPAPAKAAAPPPPPPPAKAAPPPAAKPAAEKPAPDQAPSRNPFDSLEEEMAKLLGRAPDGKG